MSACLYAVGQCALCALRRRRPRAWGRRTVRTTARHRVPCIVPGCGKLVEQQRYGRPRLYCPDHAEAARQGRLTEDRGGHPHGR